MCDCGEWSAWYDRMPGKGEPTLHVSGACTCESGGIDIDLAPGNPGTPGDPSEFVLRCTITRPVSGSTVITEVPVKWSDDVGERAERVRIYGDAEAVIPIKDVS